ncbi:MAG: type II secretion system F family protein [Actinomycetes bacterium]
MDRSDRGPRAVAVTGHVLACAVLASVACGLLLTPYGGARRLRRVFPARPPAPRSADRAGALRLPAAGVAGLGVALFFGGVVGVLGGVATAVGAARVLGNLQPAAERRRLAVIERDLPIALDLMSACLAAGTTVPDAVAAVAGGLRGPLGLELTTVLAAIDVGVSPADAWRTLPNGPLAPVGRALARAQSSGAPLAEVTAALAEERRSALHVEAAAAARRAGVAAVAPLGLCFLPAFFGAAVVPVVVGLAHHVLAGS